LIQLLNGYFVRLRAGDGAFEGLGGFGALGGKPIFSLLLGFAVSARQAPAAAQKGRNHHDGREQAKPGRARAGRASVSTHHLSGISHLDLCPRTDVGLFAILFPFH
jgi:hypothetical protein